SPPLEAWIGSLAVRGALGHRQVVELIRDVLDVVAVGVLRVLALEQRHLVAWLLLALDEVDDAVDVLVRYEGSVQPDDSRRTRRQEEHVSFAEEAFCTYRVENGA